VIESFVPDGLVVLPGSFAVPRCVASGVGQLVRIFPRGESPPAPGWFPQDSASSARAVGHDVDASSEMSCSDLGRRKHAPLRIEPELGQVPENSFQASNKEAWDVLQKDPPGLNVANDADNLRPDVAVVALAELLPGDAKRLTGESRSNEIHDSTPRASIEGSEVTPERSRIQGALFHTRRQDRGGIGFPLHVTDDAGGRLGESNAEFESSDAGAEGEDVPGT
jgi:hypothetical protein